MSAIYTWIISQVTGINTGSLTGLVTALLIFNGFMSLLQKVFNLMKISEPAWLQKIGTIGSNVTGWLSANLPTVTASAQQKIQQKQ